ncbi:hypothetical protein AXX17_AT1G10380 [Arabidopsis thaliana]|uniref:Transmembrane protein n=1 Tax=Arabidopsis thaliana TaxID=3702 RepID=A0A178WDV3_ARATH|nr:hypothetical protein AXX17_AT1G10380 [Arabidopsis thaliana]
MIIWRIGFLQGDYADDERFEDYLSSFGFGSFLLTFVLLFLDFLGICYSRWTKCREES